MYAVTELQKKYPEALIVFIPEHAMGLSPDRLAEYVSHDPKVVVMRESVGRTIGVPKTNATSEHMCDTFNAILTHNQLRFAQKVIVYKMDMGKHRCSTAPQHHFSTSLAAFFFFTT